MADSWHGFDRYPVVVGGGGGACIRLGRWIHYPRITPVQGLQFDQYPTMGVPHQKFLVSLCQGMGMNLDSMPVSSVTGADGQLVDCTGPLAELMA